MAALDNGIILVCREVPSSRFRSNVLACEHNYLWHLNVERFYRCSERKSGCSATLTALEDGNYRMNTGHNGHENKEDEIKLNSFKHELLTRASNSRIPFRSIFEAVRELNPGVHIGYNVNIQRSMQRARSSAQPRNPRTLDEAEELLIASPIYNQTRNGNSPFYQGRVYTATGSALVFISLAMLPALLTSEELAGDATFATLPLLFSQLFTIHVSAYTYMFPLAYAMMTEKTEALYTAVLRRIIEVLTALPDGGHPTITSMISDFEFAIINAMETTFPEAQSRGCWYHFGQAIYRKVCAEGLKQAYDQRPNVQKLIKMLIALALVPVNQAAAGFLHIRQQSVILLAEETPEVRHAMHIIFEYMQHYWFDTVTPERFCVQGHSRRTNNEVEAFHRWFNARCGKYHQNFWTFIEYLQIIESHTWKDFQIARLGNPIRRPQDVMQRRKDARIRRFGLQFANGEVPLGQYLEMCSSFFEPALPPIALPLVPVNFGPVDDDQIDEVDLPRARLRLLQEMGREFTQQQVAEILAAAAVLN